MCPLVVAAVALAEFTSLRAMKWSRCKLPGAPVVMAMDPIVVKPVTQVREQCLFIKSGRTLVEGP